MGNENNICFQTIILECVLRAQVGKYDKWWFGVGVGMKRKNSCVVGSGCLWREGGGGLRICLTQCQLRNAMLKN